MGRFLEHAQPVTGLPRASQAHRKDQTRMLVHLRRAARRATSTTLDRGASAVEYGLMVAAIAAVIVGTVFGLGTLVKATFTKTCSTLAVGPASLGDPVQDCGAPAADPGAGQ